MIQQITLKFGSIPGQAPLTIDTGHITVIVGPNNSGKSTLLREIDQRLANPGSATVIIDRVDVSEAAHETIDALITGRGQRHPPDANGRHRATLGKMRPGTAEARDQLSFVLQDGVWKLPDQPTEEGRRLRVAWLFTLLLDGRTRLSMFDNAPGGAVGAPPQHIVAALFRDDLARQKLRTLTQQAFDRHFVIDPTPMTQFQVRLSERAPASLAEEKMLDDAAVAFHQSARHINEYSDGVKAYTGLLGAVLSGQFRIVLIDEPDAFLHPPLVRRLGRTLGSLASTQHTTVIAATHDADFVMGAVQSGAGVSVVRLTYRGGVATARSLDAARLGQLMTDPLLRSTGVLRALFHNGAVVCEADSDRAFYEECNERILATTTDGVLDSVFLNAQNKQTIRRIVAPLRQMGIPAAAVPDLDILKGSDVLRLAGACFMEPPVLKAVKGQLRTIQAAFANAGRQLDKTGMAAIAAPIRNDVHALIKQLALYGLFIVSVGQLEDWLAQLGVVVAEKKDWLSAMFAAMGTDPTHASYVKPGNDDVWVFLRGIGRWVEDPNRKGMPV